MWLNHHNYAAYMQQNGHPTGSFDRYRVTAAPVRCVLSLPTGPKGGRLRWYRTGIPAPRNPRLNFFRASPISTK